MSPLLLIIMIVVGVLLLMSLTSMLLYEYIFGKRYETTDSAHLPKLADYPEVLAEKAEFVSAKGNKLRGAFYTNKNVQNPKALIVFSHGIFGGHIDYLPEIDYFTRNGYKVFAYDNTGCHNSEGKGMTGLPQSAVDLHSALEFLGETNTLPLLLFGHSWGGFAVSSVFNFPTPKVYGVFVQSGFNRTQDLVIEEGSAMFGGWVKIFSPFIRMYEFTKYGKISGYTAKTGVASAIKRFGTKFFILHSRDDKTISVKHSILDNVEQNENITLLLKADKGHNSLDSAECIAYKNAIDERVMKLYHSFRVPVKDRKSFYSDIDSKVFYDLDMEIMKMILDFYDKVVAEIK